MRAGRLDRVATLLRPSGSKDALGAVAPDFVRIAAVAASKVDVSDGERLRAQQVGADHTTRFQIRWSRAVAAVTAGWRLECEGAAYEVTGAKELGRRQALEITANRRG